MKIMDLLLAKIANGHIYFRVLLTTNVNSSVVNRVTTKTFVILLQLAHRIILFYNYKSRLPSLFTLRL